MWLREEEEDGRKRKSSALKDLRENLRAKFVFIFKDKYRVLYKRRRDKYRVLFWREK